MTIGIYMHMDPLITTSLQSTVATGQSTPVHGLKSGNQTPAPATKVLRWKDLEPAVIEGQGGTPGTRTPFTTPSGGMEGLEVMEGWEVRSDGGDVEGLEVMQGWEVRSDGGDIEDLFV
jgi:hypothetical protein